MKSREELELERLEALLEALGDDIAHAREVSHRRVAEGPAPHPRPEGERVTLPSGREIVVRPIALEDAPVIEEGLERTSAVSRYLCFLAPVRRLSPDQVESLVSVDHRDHEAVVALDPVTAAGIGVARFVRDPRDRSVADVSIIVVDEWQHQGVGEVLAERLAARARAVGVERLRGRMLVGSTAPLRLLEHVSDAVETVPEPGTVRATARLRC